MRLILCWLTKHKDLSFASWLGIEAVICGRCGIAYLVQEEKCS